MTADSPVVLTILAAWGALLIWSCGDQARRARDRLSDHLDLVLAHIDFAVDLAGWAAARSCAVLDSSATRWAQQVVGWGRRFVFPGRRIEAMSDVDWIGYVRRDAKVAVELAAAAEAALRAMQENGGTPAERAGVLRVVGMARAGATNAVEQLEVVAQRKWYDGLVR